jgi:hypothetical protein
VPFSQRRAPDTKCVWEKKKANRSRSSDLSRETLGLAPPFARLHLPCRIRRRCRLPKERYGGNKMIPGLIKLYRQIGILYLFFLTNVRNRKKRKNLHLTMLGIHKKKPSPIKALREGPKEIKWESKKERKITLRRNPHSFAGHIRT